jgi:hypothetical protein
MTSGRNERRRIPGRTALACAVGIVALAAFAAACSGADQISPPAVEDVGSAPDAPDESEGDGSAPETTAPDDVPDEETPPDDTAPATTPPATNPPDEAPDSSEPVDDSSAVEGGSDGSEPADELDPVLVALAVAGFVVLVGVAAWWMLRRDDPDADIGHAEEHQWPDDQMSL